MTAQKTESLKTGIAEIFHGLTVRESLIVAKECFNIWRQSHDKNSSKHSEKIERKHKPASDATIERVKILAEDGATRKEIQDELNLSRFQLARLIKKAAKSGVRISIKDARRR